MNMCIYNQNHRLTINYSIVHAIENFDNFCIVVINPLMLYKHPSSLGRNYNPDEGRRRLINNTMASPNSSHADVMTLTLPMHIYVRIRAYHETCEGIRGRVAVYV